MTRPEKTAKKSAAKKAAPKTPKIAKAVGRSVKEWIGKTNDSMPSQHIRLRIFDRDKGICFLSGLKIQPGKKWHLHHCDKEGRGLDDRCENRESNLHPVLDEPHRVETAKQKARQAKADAARVKHIGANDPSPNPIKSAGFTRVERDKGRPKIDKSALDPLPRRSIFTGEIIR